MVSSGAGRPVDENGFPNGAWTPDLLADAISQIDANGSGIELRTVQLWFQDNNKGVSSDNIRWLARVFGCGDPEATSKWQIELSAAQSRLADKRRKHKLSLANHATEAEPTRLKWRFNLARRSEAIFSGSPLDLPATVFAGSVALGFTSYFLGIHNVTYGPIEGSVKQVGFLWAPNWTFLFMVFMPLFFAFVAELLFFWKNEGRSKLLAESDRHKNCKDWKRTVESSSYTYWAVLLICLPIVGLLQWVGVRLLPLINGGEDYAIDWGTLALVRPEVISVQQAVAFTGMAYFYMCICFYLFFVGLILLYTLTHDLWGLVRQSNTVSQSEVDEVSLKILRGIFRCTISGILIATCMKLQSFYLTSDAVNIADWFVRDLSSLLNANDTVNHGTEFSRPTHYSSLIVTLATCVVFLYGSVRIGVGGRLHGPWVKMAAIIALLVVSYMLIGAFVGFSILLSVGVLIAVLGLLDPGFGRGRAREDNQNVS